MIRKDIVERDREQRGTKLPSKVDNTTSILSLPQLGQHERGSNASGIRTRTVKKTSVCGMSL